MKVEVEFQDNSAAWLRQMEQKLGKGLDRMAQAIRANARMRAPRKTGNLALTGKVKAESNMRIISFGDDDVRYAATQEAGYRTGLGGQRIYYKHYTTPGTGPHYLEQAGNQAVKEGLKKYL